MAMLLRNDPAASDEMPNYNEIKEVLLRVYQNTKPERQCLYASDFSYQECHSWKRSSQPCPPVWTAEYGYGNA
jgi:hypothetical protein